MASAMKLPKLPMSFAPAIFHQLAGVGNDLLCSIVKNLDTSEILYSRHG
jgi:hypothetical protein